jgi:DNA repair protein RadC
MNYYACAEVAASRTAEVGLLAPFNEDVAAPRPDAPDAGRPKPSAPKRSRRKRDMPRERLLDFGPGTLADAELVALVLGSGLPGHNVFGIADSLLKRFGSLRAMLDATPADFKGLPGIGPAKTAQLLAILELARRSLVEKMREKPIIDSPEAVEDYLRHRGKLARLAHADGGLSTRNCPARADRERGKHDRGA